jgi:hypothetical protein
MENYLNSISFFCVSCRRYIQRFWLQFTQIKITLGGWTSRKESFIYQKLCENKSGSPYTKMVHPLVYPPQFSQWFRQALYLIPKWFTLHLLVVHPLHQKRGEPGEPNTIVDSACFWFTPPIQKVIYNYKLG